MEQARCVSFNFPQTELNILKNEAVALNWQHSELIRLIILDWIKDIKTPHSHSYNPEQPLILPLRPGVDEEPHG